MTWTPVTERLPEQFVDVLITGKQFSPKLDIGWVHDGKFCVVDCDHYDGYEYVTGVTHWMPLPEPPQQEQSDGSSI